VAVAAPAVVARHAWISGVRRRVAPLMPVLRFVGFVAAIALVASVGVRAAADVRLRDLAWWPLPLVVAGAGAWWLLLGRGWALLARGRTTRADISLWVRTQALRFVPGGFWAPVSRVALLEGNALTRVSTVAAENVLALSASLALGGAALAISGRLAWLGLVAIVAVPLVGARLLPAGGLSPARIRRAGLNDALAFGAYAAAAVLVQIAVSGSVDAPAVAGAALVAWGAGLVVVIAPSGIGVRELVYVRLLAGTLPYGELAAASIAMRLAMIVAELAVLLVAGRPVARADVPAER
jgi:hypothetical protein